MFMIKNTGFKLHEKWTEEMETGYRTAVAERILKYFWIILIIVIGIQIYNLLFTLSYTGWKMQTQSSRVYTFFYAILLAASAAGLLGWPYFRKIMPGKAGLIIRLQVLYCGIMLAWALGITLYDQRVSENISTYLISALSISILSYMNPLQAFMMYGSAQVVMYICLPFYQPEGTNNYGSYVNASIMIIMAVFICCYRYYNERRLYQDQQKIIEQNNLLNEKANTDPLTGLQNRVFLDGKMEELYRECLAKGTDMTVMMIDVDDFKKYNDTFGHQAGDKCLKMTAQELKKFILNPEQEYLIRYGGEEFMYTGTGLDKQGAVSRAEEMRAAVEAMGTPCRSDGISAVTVSIGIHTAVPVPSEKEEEWFNYITKADDALYQAKKLGKNKVVMSQD